jgi:hypothetical protein
MRKYKVKKKIFTQFWITNKYSVDLPVSKIMTIGGYFKLNAASL